MDDKEFDKYIKQKLQEDIQNRNADWEVMHKILVDEHIIPNGEDGDFDKAVKDQLNGVRAKYNESHWAILHQRLLNEKFLKRRLVVVKVVELCMLFLLLTTTITFVPFKSELYAVSKYRPTIDKLENLIARGIDQVSSFVKSGSSNSLEIRPSAHAPAVYQVALQARSTYPVVIKSSSKREVEKYPILPSIISELAPIDRDFDNIIIPIPQKPKARDESILTASLGLSADIIETPFENMIGIQSITYNDVSNHIAMTYGVQTGQYEIFTGVGFYNTSYSPSISTGIFDSFSGNPIPLSEIDKINYGFVTIPFGLRYHLVNGSNWSVYATASANLSFLAYAHYDLIELGAAEKKLAELEPSTINQSNLRTGIDSKISQGLLQGGSLLDNINTSASIGIGLYKRLDQHLALFVQPSYNRSFSFNGVGAQEEEINSLRLDLGFRIAI